ncbi:hypothetical protein BJX99DRAFT_228328 [Aspergillus californicus]
MRPTLRRSCAACAKFKHSCDLRTPRCSRCIKRNVLCLYANEPLTAPAPSKPEGGSPRNDNELSSLTTYNFGSLDPFESYPPTRLPRDHVQRLIHSFHHKIAFQYYPLDLNASSNPFLVSWWPLALGDPALFHVSLQTACLDEELLAQKGFHASEILMADSVALLRRKVADLALAVQDGTMNSVITLAAIEFGKGNVEVSQMHVDGAKKLVTLRGGINSVRQTSPLTARMVSWVSMLVMGHPQFNTQDDVGIGDGIPPIPEWQFDSTTTLQDTTLTLNGVNYTIDPEVRNVFNRLRNSFNRARHIPFSSTQLHDLTCFVIHRLLLCAPPDSTTTDVHQPPPAPAQFTECIRYGIVLYMFIIHGPTYYSHDVILNTIVMRFMAHLTTLHSTSIPHNTPIPPSLDIWCLSIGMVASRDTPHYQWFRQRAQRTALALPLAVSCWDEIHVHMQSILWMESPQGEGIFRSHWDSVLGAVDLGVAERGLHFRDLVSVDDAL